MSYKILATLLFQIITITTILGYLQFGLNQPFYVTDFRTFYSSAKTLRHQPYQLYDPQHQMQTQNNLIPSGAITIFQDQIIPYFNPPFFLLPLLPLIVLSPQSAYQISLIIQIILVIGLLITLTKIFPTNTKHQILNTSLIALSFAPVYFAIIHTQSSLFTLAIFVATYLLLKRQRYFITGLIASLLLYKPQLGIFLYLFLLVQKNKSLTLGLITGGTILFLFSYLLVGNHLFDLIAFTLQYSTVPGTSPHQRISWFGFFYPFPSGQILATIASITTMFYVLPKLSKSSNLPYQFSFIIFLTLLCSLHVHYQETSLLLFPFYYFLSKYSSQKFWILVASVWTIFLLTIFSPFFPDPLPYIPTLTILILLVVSIKNLPSKYATHNSPA